LPALDFAQNETVELWQVRRFHLNVRHVAVRVQFHEQDQLAPNLLLQQAARKVESGNSDRARNLIQIGEVDEIFRPERPL